MARILVTEKIADGGLQRLRDAGHDVDVQLGLSPGELVSAVPGAAGLIIRSATRVTAEVLEADTDLVVVGRAGIGLDNVDVEVATARGVMVVNAPQSNILSTAEHTMAMLLAQASGRLIRNATDRGVVAVLDRRLGTARYRWDIVRALPPMRRTRDRTEVEAFLRELTA
mgnify:CR=1 FL=1